MRALSLLLMRLLPLHKGRVIFLCWNGQSYGCNPKAIADTIVNNPSLASRFDVWFAFCSPKDFSNCVPEHIRIVELGSFEYYILLFTSNFIVSNIHCSGDFFPYKKRGQIYIFTGHGASGIKKIEHDALSLDKEFLKYADVDVKRIDLFLSCSCFRSGIIRSAYQYNGEILETGAPRNDVFFKSEFAKSAESACKKYLIYTPTFRNNGRKDVYGFDVDKVISALESRFGGEWYIRVSSHPNMRGYYHEVYDFSHPRLIDVGNEDLQPLLLTSDALITDYSSAEMDFSLTGRPIFQLCKDCQDYDRGFYLNPETLPFPYAETEEQLVQNILSFDADKFAKDLEAFNRDVIGLHETGHAAEAVVEWMINKMNA